MEGSSRYELVTKKLAISPAPLDDEPIQRKPSYNKQTTTPSTGPNKKDIRRINTLPKSSFKKLAPKSGKGISKKLTA